MCSSSARLADLPPRARRTRPVFHRPVLSLFLCLVCSAIAAPAQDAPAEHAVHGSVLNSVTREPIARALVTAFNASIAVFTDDQGKFSFTVPASRQIVNGDLVVRKPGFLEDESSRIIVSLSPENSQDLNLALTPESLIIGRVHLPKAGSFERMNLQLYRRDVSEGRAQWHMFLQTRTHANGEFRFFGLRAGTYKLFTLELADRDPQDLNLDGPHFGYPPSYYPAATDFSAAAPITLAPGQTFEAELTPPLHEYFQVRISLPNATPDLRAVEIAVFPRDHPGPGYSLGFDSRQQTITGELPNGTYTVEAIADDKRMTGITTFTVHDSPALTPVLLLASIPEIPISIKAEFTNKPRPDISGAVRFSSPSARPPSTMSMATRFNLISADEASRRSSEGLYVGDISQNTHLSAVPGRYYLQSDPQRGYVASASSAGVDLLLNPLVVTPGSNAPIDVTLRDDTAEIHGTIEDTDPDKSNFSSLPSVYCVPLPDSPGKYQPGQTTRTQADVSFSCPLLAPGSYRVLAFEHPQPEFEYRNPEAMRPFESKGPVVRVNGGQKESVRIPLNP